MDPDPVTVVTTAGRSGTEDRQIRRRRYAMTQLVRVSCFLLAVALPVPLGVKLLFIVGAFVLPWVGVVTANAGPVVDKRPRSDALIERAEPVRIALEPGRDIDG